MKPPIIARFYQRILSIVHIPPTLGSAAAVVKEKGKRQKRELKLDTHPSNKRRRRGGRSKKKSGILLLRSFLPISQVVLRGTGKGSISQSGEEDEELFSCDKISVRRTSMRRRAGDGASDDGFCGISTICLKIWIVKSARMDNTSRAVRRLGMGGGEMRKRGNSRPPQKS